MYEILYLTTKVYTSKAKSFIVSFRVQIVYAKLRYLIGSLQDQVMENCCKFDYFILQDQCAELKDLYPLSYCASSSFAPILPLTYYQLLSRFLCKSCLSSTFLSKLVDTLHVHLFAYVPR